MRELVTDYLSKKLSRRGFVSRLGGLGFSVAGAEAILAPLEASELAGSNHPGASGYSFEGTGGALVIEQAKAAGAGARISVESRWITPQLFQRFG